MCNQISGIRYSSIKMSIILIAYGSDSTVTLSAPNADSHIDSH